MLRPALTALLPAVAAADAVLWPSPASATHGAETVAVLPGPGFFSANVEDDFFRAAFGRYAELAFPHATEPRSNAAGGVTGLHLLVASQDDAFPQLGVDESYNLSVAACAGGGNCTATATAATRYGALRALETFSQLVHFNFDSGGYEIRGAPWQVADRPRFPHRGLMVDTGRHFLPLAVLKKVVDSLPYAKLNVLHWHMVDSQSFPFQSKSRPELWRGAFSPEERYTQADVREVLEYARLRGVRVMVEFDMPGHGASWCRGYPEVCPAPSCPEPLNPASNATFELVEALLDEVTGGKELAGLFPEGLLHLGGDEVNTACWSKTPQVREWLQARNMSAKDGYKYFVRRAAEAVIARGRRPVQWSEVWDNFKTALPKGSIVHVWLEETNVKAVAAAGYDVIRNSAHSKDAWYLDHLTVPWSAIYLSEPCRGLDTPELCAHVLGGHGEMWGETVDGSDMENTVWPRLAAIAEKLWSPREQTQDAAAALPRIEEFRCLLLSRGVAAALPGNAVARAAPPGPGGCRQRGKAEAAVAALFA